MFDASGIHVSKGTGCRYSHAYEKNLQMDQACFVERTSSSRITWKGDMGAPSTPCISNILAAAFIQPPKSCAMSTRLIPLYFCQKAAPLPVIALMGAGDLEARRSRVGSKERPVLLPFSLHGEHIDDWDSESMDDLKESCKGTLRSGWALLEPTSSAEPFRPSTCAVVSPDLAAFLPPKMSSWGWLDAIDWPWI